MLKANAERGYTFDMRVDESITLVTAVGNARAQNLIQAWRIGQILDAVVERVTSVGNGTLNVNNQSVEVRTNLPLTVGAKLALEVAQTGAQIVLRVLNAAPLRRPVADTLRTLLPQQASLAPALARLASLVRAPADAGVSGRATGTAIPPPPDLAAALGPAIPPRPAAQPHHVPPSNPVLELARKILDRLPTPRQIQTPDELREAVKNAGPFFERKLAGGAPSADIDASLDGDMKAGLLRLVALLRTPSPTAPATPPEVMSPPERGTVPRAAPRPAAAARPHVETLLPDLRPLEDDVRAALARVTLQQLASLPRDESAPPQWLLDVPVRNGERIEIFHLHIFREKKPRDPKFPPAWCVRLSFDLVTLGPINVLVTYHALAVSVSLWAKERATVTLFERHLEQLRSQLRAEGVHVSHLHCECGNAPFAHDPVHELKHHSLVDERV